MSRPEPLNTSAPCTPVVDYYRPDGVTLQQPVAPGSGQSAGSTTNKNKNKNNKDHAGAPAASRDRLVKTAKRSGARARLGSIAGGERPPWCSDQSAPAGKLEPTKGRSVPLNPALERDPKVKAYRFDQRTNSYQVTRYDPRQVKFDRSGRALTGPLVKLDNREMKLGDAIKLINSRAVATLGTVDKLLQGPAETNALPACRPVLEALKATITLCAGAEALQRAGKPAEAGRALSRAADAYNLAVSKLKTAKHQVVNNSELAIGVLTALKEAGEFAELVLVVTGVGAATKGLGSGSKLLIKAGAKAAHAATVELRNQALLKPDQPIAWSKVGKKAAEKMVLSLVSGAISEGVTQGLKAAGGGAALSMNKTFLAKLFSKAMAKVTKEVVQSAEGRQERCTPRQLFKRVMNASEAERSRILAEVVKTLSKDIGSAAASTFAKDAFAAMAAR